MASVDVAALAAAHLTRALSALPPRVSICDTLGLTLPSTPPHVDVSAHAGVERAFGAALAHVHTRTSVLDRVRALIDSGKASKKLSAALAKWLSVSHDAAAAEEALLFADQWLAREAPFEPQVAALAGVQEALHKRSVWVTSADGWADAPTADIPALHNLFASGEDLNVMLFVTDAAATSPPLLRRDVGLYALNYGGTYVASTCPTASLDAAAQFEVAVREADAFPGPAIVIVYIPAAAAPAPSAADAAAPTPVAAAPPGGAPTPASHEVLESSAAAVASGAWPLYRYNPTAAAADAAADAVPSSFKIDSVKLRDDIADFVSRESHLALLARTQPTLPASLTASVETDMAARAAAAEERIAAAYAKMVAGLTLPPLVVLFGSDGGNAEGVAKKLAAEARKRGFTDVTLKAMDAYAPSKLASTQLALFVVSTAGQGEFPMNARSFWKTLSAGVSAAASTAASASVATAEAAADALVFPELRYAVFGLGDSNYWPKKEQRIFFNKASVDLDAALHATGAVQLVERGVGDDQDVGGYTTGFKAWLPGLWAALGVGAVSAEEDTTGKVRNPEDVKKTSRWLRGTIAEGLTDTSTGALAYEDTLLTKFHGIYQQDDRDARAERKRRGLEPAFSFMVRVRIPGGVATPAQYLALDSIADRYANGTIRVTTRQAVQFHGIIKGVLKASIQGINRALMDSLAACGDVNRNVMCTAAPAATSLHAAALDFSARLSDHLTPRTSAYHEIWLEDKLVRGGATDAEPIYGPTYLPRKFKIAVAIPPSNDVDVYAHDLGFIAIPDASGELAGFTITIGGGMGMTHNAPKTYPRLADELCFATVEQAIAVAEAVVTTQRDYGDRTNRKHARLKYTVDDKGLDWFRAEVGRRCGFPLEPPRAFKFANNGDRYGWTDAGNDSWNYTLFIQNGRIVDAKAPSTYRLKTGLKALAEGGIVPEFRFTANQNIILSRIPTASRPAVDALLMEYGIHNGAHTGLRLNSMACVALPTCGLALAESERYLPTLLDKLDAVIDAAGLHNDAITVRMTGCPNGCARPYVAEIGFVGRSPGIYNLYLGAGIAGQRLNKLYREGVDEAAIIALLTPLIKRYAVERLSGDVWTAAHAALHGEAVRMEAGNAEPFGDWLIRAGVIRATTAGRAFHDDLPADVSAGAITEVAPAPAIEAGRSKRAHGAAAEASIPE